MSFWGSKIKRLFIHPATFRWLFGAFTNLIYFCLNLFYSRLYFPTIFFCHTTPTPRRPQYFLAWCWDHKPRSNNLFQFSSLFQSAQGHSRSPAPEHAFQELVRAFVKLTAPPGPDSLVTCPPAHWNRWGRARLWCRGAASGTLCSRCARNCSGIVQSFHNPHTHGWSSYEGRTEHRLPASALTPACPSSFLHVSGHRDQN